MKKDHLYYIMMFTSILLGFSFNNMMTSMSVLSISVFVLLLITLIIIVVRFKKM